MFTFQNVVLVAVVIGVCAAIGWYIVLSRAVAAQKAKDEAIEKRFDAAVEAGLIPLRERVSNGICHGLAHLLTPWWMGSAGPILKAQMLEKLDKGFYIDYPNNMPKTEEAA